MKAKILPLKGKYYGTKIEVNFNDGRDSEWLVLWNTNGGDKPSVRECHDGDCDFDEYCDCHYESEITYKRAKLLCEAINSYSLKVNQNFRDCAKEYGICLPDDQEGVQFED